jgi:FkbM family methyltransferase
MRSIVSSLFGIAVFAFFSGYWFASFNVIHTTYQSRVLFPYRRKSSINSSVGNMDRIPSNMVEQEDYKWAHFFAEMREELIDGRSEQEMEIHKAIYVTQPRHELCERYPLKPIPVVLETAAGICFFGSHLTKGTICENALRGKSTWSPDPHVRDIITTVLLPCSLRSQRHDCFAIDVGSNFGAHTLVMLELGARVVSIEPQLDLCVASRISASALGYADRCLIVCGGISPNEATPRTSTFKINKDTFLWRYFGDVPIGTNKHGYSISGDVPLVSLKRLVATQSRVDFLKIDTDSIDCDVLQQAINLTVARGVLFRAMMLETASGNCADGNKFGHQLVRLSRMGYTIYRTLVYERSWDEHHRDYENDFRAVPLPKGWTEEFHVGFNFVLWKANADSLSADELLNHPQVYPAWQYLFTKDFNVVQSGYRTKEL